MMRRFYLTAALVLAAFAPARADGLLITPHRVVFEGRDREAGVTLTNSGTEATTFRLSLTNYRMNERGGFDPVTGPVAWQDGFADKMIRFSPRQVELGPGETQVVRVQLRLPAEITLGEYRTHLVFQALPKSPELNRFESKNGRTRATINTIYGVSIPVIVRRGRTFAEVKLTGLQLASPGGQPTATFDIEREGSQSVYGNVKITLTRANEELVVGESNGLAVYTPLPRRNVAVSLRLPAQVAGARLTAVYEDEAGRELARQAIELR